MKRRNFIFLSASGLIALASPSACRTKRQHNPALAQPEFLSRLCTEKEIVSIGKAYRRLAPGEDGERELESLLLTDASGKTLAKDSVRQWLNDQVTQDFHSGRIAVIDGWVLATTEARQCAVYSITHP